MFRWALVAFYAFPLVAPSPISRVAFAIWFSPVCSFGKSQKAEKFVFAGKWILPEMEPTRRAASNLFKILQNMSKQYLQRQSTLSPKSGFFWNLSSTFTTMSKHYLETLLHEKDFFEFPEISLCRNLIYASFLILIGILRNPFDCLPFVYFHEIFCTLLWHYLQFMGFVG